MFYRYLLQRHLNVFHLHIPKCCSFNHQFHLLSNKISRQFPLKLCPSELKKSFKFPFSQSHPCLIESLNSRFVTATELSNIKDFPTGAFPEHENKCFHQILRKNVHCQHLMMQCSNGYTEPQNVLTWADILQCLDDFLSNFNEYSHFEILRQFTKLTNLPPDKEVDLLTNQKFIQICELLISQLSEWNHEEFFCLMQVLIKFDFHSCITPILRTLRLKLSSKFDKECVKRIPQFTTEQLFQACDFFFYFRYNKYSKFSQTFFNLIQDKTLSDTELIVALFYANLSRNVPKKFIDNVLESISSIADSLTLEEMAIICLGFFKTKYQIRNTAFLETMIDKLYREINLTDPITVSALFKGLQISTTKTLDKAFPSLFSALSNVLNSVTKEIIHYPLTTFMHVFLYFHFIHFVNDEFIAKVKERLTQEDISQWRIKDIAKITYSVTNLGALLLPMPEFWEKVLKDLESPERQREINIYPQCLLSTLVAMSFIGLYPEKLIGHIFQPTTLASFDSLRKNTRLDFRRELFQLNESVRLECPDYNGCLLPDNFLKSISKNHEIFGRLPDVKSHFNTISQRDTMFFEVVQNLNKLFKNKNKYLIDFLLPHFQTADIEIRLDVEGEAVPCDLWRSSPTKTVETPITDCYLTDLLLHLANGSSFQRIAVVLFGPNCYCRIYDPEKGGLSYHLLGLHQTKLRQLEKKGFKVVKIPFFELPGGPDQLNYLQQKIFKSQSKH